MPIQPDGTLLARTKPSQSDHMVLHFDPWRAYNLGTTTATITLSCPDVKVGNRRAQIAIHTLYATATGTGGQLAVQSGADTIAVYRLADGVPLQMNFYPGNLTIEPGETLTLAITGASGGASITATGVFYR